MASDINPSLTPTKSLNNFRFWCQKVLPLVYDDSLSYYEVLGKMVVQLNDVIDNINADTENVLTLKDAFLELQTYVNEFFDDIDQLASYAERAETAQTAANQSAINAASSASNASASSLAAMDAKDAAVAARQAAETSANTASTAATNANTKASEAAQSAIAAQTAQANASQSATLAATDRSAAQTAASTATSKANEASTSASNAQTSAENAAQSKADAEDLVDNIQENLTNIQQNTNDIGDLKESINGLTNINYTLGDGYFADYNNGVIIPDTGDTACKYTNKFTSFDGLEINITEIHDNSHALWLAVGEWLTNGAYRRITLQSLTGNRISYNYIPNEDVKEFAFCYRSYNDATVNLSLTVNVSLQDIYKTLITNTEKITSATQYNFSNHIIKGINHRGYNTVAPEETLPAYQLSVENGFKFLECDVRFTSDNVPVLLHDHTVDRTSNGTGQISDMTYAQARELDFGSWKSEEYAGTKIMSFEEFIIFCKSTASYPYVEIEPYHLSTENIALLLTIVKKYGMERSITWIASDILNLQRLLAQYEEARCGLLIFDEPTEEKISEINTLFSGKNQVFLDCNVNYTTEALALAKNANVPLELWIINSQNTMESLDEYISGVTSDSLNFETIKKNQALS